MSAGEGDSLVGEAVGDGLSGDGSVVAGGSVGEGDSVSVGAGDGSGGVDDPPLGG